MWKEKKLVKSHIIPKSLYPDGDKKIYSSCDYAKKSPSGVYDQNIMCEDCEKNNQDIDNQAKKY